MTSDLLKNACFTVLKKKGDKLVDSVEPSTLLNKSPVVQLQISSKHGSSVNMYSRLPSLNERSISPGLKASKEFSFFQGKSDFGDKRKDQLGNSWVRKQPLQTINTKSYAEEIDHMIAANLKSDLQLSHNPFDLGKSRLEKSRQQQAQGSLSPRYRPANQRRNRSSVQFRHLGTMSTDRSRDEANTSSLAGASQLDLEAPHGERNTGFGVEKTITILQSIRKDKSRNNIFKTLIESYHKKDDHDQGFAELYEKFRQTSKKTDAQKFGVPVAAMNTPGANSNREIHTLRYFYMAISSKINQEHEASSPELKFKQIQTLHDFVMKTCSDLIPSHYKEVLDFYAQVYHDSLHARETHTNSQKKPNTARTAFGAYLSSTAVGQGERHPFETGTPANPKLLKKNISNYSQSQEGQPMFQSSLQERFADLAEELRVANHRLQLLREEAALKERGLIVAFEKIKAYCIEMKRSQEVMISAYNKKCALINSLNERLYGEAAKAKLEAMWDDQTLKRIYGIDSNYMDDDLLDMDIEVIQKSGSVLDPHGKSFAGSQAEQNQEKAEREKALAKRKVLLKRYVVQRSDSVELGQMRRKDKLNLEANMVENLKNRLNLKDFQGETANLIWYDNKGIQTEMSFADPKYDRILQSQPELDLYHQRTMFEDRIQTRLNSSNFMYFLTDDIIRSMFDKEVWDLAAKKPVEFSPEKVELLANLKEVDLEGELEDKSIKRNTVLKASDRSESMDKRSEGQGSLADRKFSVETIEDFINFKVHLQMPMNEGLMKYLFISYLYVLFERKKKQDLINTRESQIQVLQDIISKHKAKLADQDLRLMKYKQHVEVFNDLHKDCKVGVALGDFTSDPAEIEPSDKEKKQMAQSIVTVNGLEEKENTMADDANVIAMENLMLRVWKIKAVSKEKNKKYMSFKFVYEKIHRFFQIRLQEVELLEPNKVDHPYSLEEHFFRILTEKDVNVKKVEEKIKNFIVTLLNLEPNPKLTVMKKFLRLMPGGMFYGQVEEYFYLRCMEYIKTESRGLEVPVNSQGGTNFVSFEKFEGYLNKYVHPRLNPKSSSLLLKAVRGHVVTVADASLGLLAKKGLIDIDDGIEEVFKWVFAKSEQAKPMEHYMDLFAILDISFVGRISFSEFTTLYNAFSKRGYLEKGKLLLQLDNYVMENPPGEVSIQTQLDSSTFHTQLRSLKNYAGSAKLFDQIQKFSPEYILSSDELRQLFSKNAIEGLDGTSEQHLTFLSFCNVLNEFEHLFDVDKILKYLGLSKPSMLEGEYFAWKSLFLHHYGKYVDFIQYSIIPDTNWRNNTLKRLGAIKDLFEDESKVYADYKAFLGTIAAENSLNWSLIEPKLEVALQIKTLVLYRFLLIDMMHVDFEQRVDFASPIQLPEVSDLMVSTPSVAKQSQTVDKMNFSLTNLGPTKFLYPPSIGDKTVSAL